MIFTYLSNHIVIFTPTPEGKYKFDCPPKLGSAYCDLKDLNHI